MKMDSRKELDSHRPLLLEKKPNTVFFRPGEKKIALVMQISNFQHRKGGFRNKLLLGLAQPVHEYQMQNWFVEVFSIGLLFVMGLRSRAVFF